MAEYACIDVMGGRFAIAVKETRAPFRYQIIQVDLPSRECAVRVARRLGYLPWWTTVSMPDGQLTGVNYNYG